MDGTCMLTLGKRRMDQVYLKAFGVSFEIEHSGVGKRKENSREGKEKAFELKKNQNTQNYRNPKEYNSFLKKTLICYI